MAHRWAAPEVIDHTQTIRRCVKCPMLKISRHEPDNWPQHWYEYDRCDGTGRFHSETVPECTGVVAPKQEKKAVGKAPKKAATEPPKEDAPLRLVELRVENFRKLKAVRITPDGGLFTVSGRNEQGKSAVLDSVYTAIGGKKYFPATPIRTGEDNAEIMLDFGGLKITRTIWRKEDGAIDHKVVLQYADGKRAARPQDVLNELLGSPIADDPLAFSKMKPKEQYDLLKGLVPNVDFDDIAARRADLYETRTQVGREFERLKGAVLSIAVPQNARTEAIDVSALAAKLREVGEYNAAIERRRDGREATAQNISDNLDEIDRIEANIKNLQVAIASLKQTNGELQAKLDNAEPLPDLMDAAVIEQEIAQADELNKGYRARTDRDAKIKERDDKEAEYEDLSKQIVAVDQEKADAIAAANLPVEGLSFGDEQILLDGLPFADASTARKIRTATALLMAMKPELRVLLVREGSLLDPDARAALEADAEANGFVVLMECVGAGDGSGIVIEDGEMV